MPRLMHRPAPHRTVRAVLMALLMLPFFFHVTDAQTTPERIRYGLDHGSVQRATEQGIKPELASFWVGPWTRNDWPNFNNYLQRMNSAGVTPLIMWYYWGDDITPKCVQDGCFSSLHNTQKTRADWNALANTMAKNIRDYSGGKQVLIVVESEFNKGGIDSATYAPTFDKYLSTQMKMLDDVPGVDVVLGFGNWGRDKWTRFPLSIAQADYIGFQAMSGMTRDTLPRYLGNMEATLGTARFIQNELNKPSILTDLALSSYTEPLWRTFQDLGARIVLAQTSELRQAGVHAIVYRSLRDTMMDPANYYGMAERHWGLQTRTGDSKPIFRTWEAASKGDPLPFRVYSMPASVEAEGFYSRGGGNLVADKTASNLFLLALPPGAEAGFRVRMPDDGTMEVRARMRAASGEAHAAILVDGSEVGRMSGGTTFFADTVSSQQSGETHVLRIRNVGSTNLLVDWMAATKASFDAPARPVQSDVTQRLAMYANLAPVASHIREAELFATQTVGQRQSSTVASGGAVWNLWSNGHLEDGFRAYRGGSFQVAVDGRGESAGGVAPRVVVSVDGTVVGSLDLTARDTYTTGTFHLERGSHTVRVAFTNDAVVGNEDRNAIIDRISLVYLR